MAVRVASIVIAKNPTLNSLGYTVLTADFLTTTVTFTFSEAIREGSFTLDDVKGTLATGSSWGALTRVSSTVYTATLIANPGMAAASSTALTVDHKDVNDANGNPGEATGSASATAYRVDTTRPAVTSIALVDTNLTAGETTTVTFTFNKSLDVDDGLKVEDIDLLRANVSLVPGSLRKVTDNSWTATLKANDNVSRTSTSLIRVNQAGLQDVNKAAGVGYSADNLSSAYTVHTQGPALSTAADGATVSGNQLVLRYDEALDAAHKPEKEKFTVTVTPANGTAGTAATAVTNAVNTVDVAGQAVTLTLATPVQRGQTVTVSYADPAEVNDVNAIQNAAGNDAASFTARAVTNNTPPGTPPVLVTTGANAPKIILNPPGPLALIANQLELTFTDDSDLGAGTAAAPLPEAFTVAVDGRICPVGTVAVAGKTVTLTLAPSYFMAADQGVTVSYTDPTSRDDVNAIQDADGNDATSFANQPVVNNIPRPERPTEAQINADHSRPVLNALTVDGNQLVLTFIDETWLLRGAAHEPLIGDFSVKVNDAVVANAVTAVRVDSRLKQVILTLANGVAQNDRVEVSYNNGLRGPRDDNAIWDEGASYADSFTDRLVTNLTDTSPPVLTNTGANAPWVDGDRLVLSFTDANNLSATGPLPAAFTVRVGEAANQTVNAVTGVLVNAAAKTVTLTLATPVTNAQKVSVSYTDPAGNDTNAIQDNRGNDAASFTVAQVLNKTPIGTMPTDNTAPVFASATVNGRQLVLSYTEANLLDATNKAAPGAFTVQARSQTNAITNVAVTRVDVNAEAKTVTLTLVDAVTSTQTVSVSYTKPTGGNDTAAIQDATGNDAASFETLVTNNTPTDTDNIPPVLASATINGNQLVLTYTEANSLDAINKAAPAAFAVRANGQPNAVTRVDVNAQAKTVTLTLVNSVVPGDGSVTVSYTKPTGGDDSAAIQDATGNDAVSFPARSVTNITTGIGEDGAPPVLLITEGPDAPKVNGDQLVLKFSTTIHDLAATAGPPPTAFTVRVDGNTIPVQSVDIAGTTVTLTLRTPVTREQSVTVSYADLTPGNDGYVIQDNRGTDSASFTGQSVANHTPASSSVAIDPPPVLVTTGPKAPKVLGNQLTLTYSDDLGVVDASPPPAAFAVLVNGVANTVNSVAVAGKTVTLILNRSVTSREAVTVSYTDPTSRDDASAVQDIAGNDAASFRGQVVRNLADVTAPEIRSATVTGNLVTLSYTEATRLGDGLVPASAFSAVVNGAPVAITNVDMSAASGNRIVLTLARPALEGEAVTLNYTKPASGFVIEDTAGNDADGFRAMRVDNRTDITPPVLVTSGTDAPRVEGNQLLLTFTDTNHLGTAIAAADAFVVHIGNTAVRVTGVDVDSVGKIVRLTLATAAKHGEAVTVRYNDPTINQDDANALQDAAGNDTPSFGNQAVINNTLEANGPLLLVESVNAPRVKGNQLVLTYSDASDRDLQPYRGSREERPAVGDGDHYMVHVDGARNTVTNVAVSGKNVTLTLATPVAYGQQVRVSYREPSNRDDSAGIQDANGNDTMGFVTRPVINANDPPAARPEAVTPPVIPTGGNPPSLDWSVSNGDELTLAFAHNASELSLDGPKGSAFTVRVRGVLNIVTGVRIDPLHKTVTLKLTTPVSAFNGLDLYVSYDRHNSSHAIKDVAGNYAPNFTRHQVMYNINPKMFTPVFDRLAVDGDQLDIFYVWGHPLGSAPPPAEAFTVRVDDVVIAVTNVNVTTRYVTLTLATRVGRDQRVTLSYTDPSSRDDERAIQDGEGNDAASFTALPVANYTSDTAPPVLVTNGANAPKVDGDRLVLHYADASSLGKVGPLATAFTVTVSGSVVDVTRVVVDDVAKTVTLVLASAVTATQWVSVSYDDLTSGNDANAVQDVDGRDAASFATQMVRNDTREATPPVLVIAGSGAPRVIGDQLKLNFTDASDLGTGAAAPPATAFTVRVNGEVVAVNAVSVAGKAVTLTLAAAVVSGQTVTVGYTDPTGRDDEAALQDAVGNDVPSFPGQPVIVDNAPPVLVTEGDDAPKVIGDQLTLHYTDVSDLGAGAAAPSASAFTVLVNGTPTAVNAVAVAGKTVTLTLASSVAPGQPVLISYTDPSVNNDSAAIQDIAGNDAANIPSLTVTNATPAAPSGVDSTPPLLVTTGPNAPRVLGNKLTLHYTDASDLNAVAAVPLAAAFTVRVNGVVVAVNEVGALGQTVTLTLASAVASNQTVTVSYADPTAGDDVSAIQDAAGNDAISFEPQAVRNLADATAPVISSATVTGNLLTLTYTEAARLADGAVPASAFSVVANGVVLAVANVDMSAASDNRIVLTLARPALEGEAVTLSYARPTSGFVIEDAAGNDADSFRSMPVDNRTDTAPPVLITTGVNAPRVDGNQLVLTFTDTHDLGATTASANAYTVRINDNVVRTDAAVVDPVGKTVRLTLATAARHGQNVSVSYADPTSGDDLNAVQDAAGNDALNFSSEVTNNTREANPPQLVTTGVHAPTVSGNHLVLTYTDETNFDLSHAVAYRGYYTVYVNGVGVDVNQVVAHGKNVTLVLASHVRPGQKVTVSYIDPEPGDDVYAIQDAVGNDTPTVLGQPVINVTPGSTGPDTTPPVLSSATVNGNQLVLTYTDDNRLDAVNYPHLSYFKINVDGVNNTATVVGVNEEARSITLILTTPVTQGQRVTIRDDQTQHPTWEWMPEGGGFRTQDIAGNHPAFITTDMEVTNLTDTTGPVLVTDTALKTVPRIHGARLLLDFTDINKLDHINKPAAANFRVRANNTDKTITSVFVNPDTKQVQLMLDSPVIAGETVTVSYTDPSSGNDDNAIQDIFGNDAAGIPTRAVINLTDPTTPPMLVTTGAEAPKVNGNQLLLTYIDERGLGGWGPSTGAFTVRVDGVATAVTNVSVSGKTVTLTLAASVGRDQRVTVSYTDPSSRNDAAAIQDSVGNDAYSFTNQAVLNTTPDAAPPVLITTGANAPKVDGDRLVLHYADASNLHATGPASTAFAVRVNGAFVNNAISRVVVDQAAKTVTLVLTTAVTAGQTVIVNYTDPTAANDTNAVQDVIGNDAASFTTLWIRNDTVNTTPPVLVTTGDGAPRVFGDQLRLNFTVDGDLGTGAAAPPATAFAVRVNGVAVAVNTVSVAAKTVTLTLATAPAPDQTVTVSYTDPTDNNDVAAVQGAVGNDAASFTNQAVIVDNAPPVLLTTGRYAPKVTGDRLVLNYADDSNLGAGAAAPAASAFTVRVDDVVTAVRAVDVTGRSITLTLATAVRHDQRVTVGYTDPSGNNDAAAIQDAVGNDAVSTAALAVVNNTPALIAADTTPPVLVTTGDNAPKVIGNQLVLNYTDDSNLGAGDAAPPATAFTVRVNGAIVAVNNVGVAGKTVTLTLASNVAHGQQVTIGYIDPGSRNDARAVQDAAGNDALSFANQPVNNNTAAPAAPPAPAADTEGPVLIGATVNGDRVVLSYSDASRLNDDGTYPFFPDVLYYKVSVDGVYPHITDVIVGADDRTVTLILRTPVREGQQVTVRYDTTAYTAPGPMGHLGPIDPSWELGQLQDMVGNNAPFVTTARPVTNLTDVSGPVLVTAGPGAPKVDGDQLVLSYTDATSNSLDAIGPLASAFTVRAAGVVNAVTRVLVDSAAKTVTLTLADPVRSGQAVTVDYADPTSGNDTSAVQDGSGNHNDAGSFNGQLVANNTPEVTPPALVTTGAQAPRVNADQLVLNYTDASDLGAVGPDNAAFTVNVAGVVNAVTRTVVDPTAKTITLTLTTRVTHGQPVTVSYADPGRGDDARAIQDAAGSDAASFVNQRVENNTPDTTAPVLITEGVNAPEVNGNQLVLHYTDTSALSATNGPANTAFTVRVDDSNTINAVTNTVVDAVAKTVTLTLTTAVTSSQQVTISYTEPSAGDDIAAIQDAAGNDAASFVSRVVTNNTSEATPPVLVSVGALVPRVNGNQLVLNFSDDSNLGATGPDNTAFTVRVGDAGDVVNNAVTRTVVDPVAKTVTLTLATAVAAGQQVSLSYTDPSVANDTAAIQDAAGNDVDGFGPQTVRNDTPDTTPPELITTGDNAPRLIDNRLTLHFTDISDLGTGVAKPPTTAFSVLANGHAIDVTRVDVAGKVVTLTLATAPAPGQTVTVGYTDPSVNNDASAIQDATGNDALSFPNRQVRGAADTTPPVLVTTGDNEPKVNGNLLTLNYTDDSNLGTDAAKPPISAFAVRVAGSAVVVSSVAVTGKTVLLTLADAVAPGQLVSVSYTDPAAGANDATAIQDMAGNDADSFPLREVRNDTRDTTAPVLLTSGENAPRVSGNQLVLTYNDTSDLAAATPPLTAFEVLVNGAAVPVLGVTALGKTVTLTLASAPTPGQTVSVTYTDPSVNNDASAIQDVAGNDAASFGPQIVSRVADTTAPTLVTTGAEAPKVNGSLLTLNFADNSNLGADAAKPPATAFAVLVNNVTVAVNNVAVAGKTVLLTLAAPVTAGQTVFVSYTDPTLNADDVAAIQDTTGNDALSFVPQTVRNETPDTARPVLVTTGDRAPRVIGDQLTLHYNDASDLGTGAAKPPTAAFTVRVDDTVVAVNNVVVDGKTVTLTLASAPTPGRTVTVSYTDPTSDNDVSAIQDVAGNDADSVTNQPVNSAPDTTRPTLVTTGPNAPKINGDRLVLTYDDDSNLGTGAARPPVSAFEVRVGGNAVTVSSVDVLGKTVTLRLPAPVTPEQVVTVRYTDPSAINDPAAIQDTTGNDADGFGALTVHNETPDTTRPTLVTTAPDAPKVIGDQLTLHFADNSDLGTGTAKPLPAAFAVRVNDVAVNVTTVDVLGKTVTLTLAAPVTPGQRVSVSYTDPSAVTDDPAVIQDVAGNDADSFTLQAVRNDTRDTTPPALVTTAPDAPKVIGNQLTLKFADDSDLGAGIAKPLPATFAVRVNDVAVNVTTVDVLGKTVTLTLAAPVTPGQRVSVGYTDPSVTNDPAAIQDAEGNDAVSFTARDVRNDTPDTTRPVLITEGSDAPRVIGDQLTLHFDDTSDLRTGAGKPPTTAFVVRFAGNPPVAVTNVDVAGKTVTLTLASAPTPGQQVIVRYNDPSVGDDDAAIQDAAGNDALTFTEQPVNSAPDTARPTLVTTGPNAPKVNGSQLVLTYDDDSNLGVGSAAPQLAAFEVRVAGNVVTVSSVDVLGKTVTLTLAAPVTAGQLVNVRYTDPSTGDDPAAIQDTSGNDADSLTTPQDVRNDSPDTSRPTLVTTAPDAPKIVGNQLTLHFADNSDLGTGTAKPPVTAFDVRVAGNAVAVTRVDVAGKVVTLTLATPVTAQQTVTVSYTDPSATTDDAAVIQDMAGNDADSFTLQSVRNDTTDTTRIDEVDTTPPVLVTEGADAPTVNGRQLVLHYSDINNLSSRGPGGNAFTVRVGDTAARLTNVVPNPERKTVTLTLATAVTPGQQVFISYTDPTTENDNRAIQDDAGNDAISFTNQSVFNATTSDATPPVLVTTGAGAPTVNGNRLVLTYTDDNNLGSGASAPVSGAFTVRADGVLNNVTAVSVDGKTVTLTLTTAVTSSQLVNIGYTDPTGGNDLQAVQDVAGNDAITIPATVAVTNNTPPPPDTTAPVLRTTGADAPRVNGNQLVLTYEEINNLRGLGPDATAFTVRVGETVNVVINAAVDPERKTVTLTLTNPVAAGQVAAVTVSYVAPGANPIQDVAGNNAVSFTNVRVDSDTTPPVFREATVTGDFLVITFTEETTLDYRGMPAAAAFSVHVNGAVVAVTRVEYMGGDNQVVLTLASLVTEGQTVTVGYTKPTEGFVIEDVAGNETESFAGRSVTNRTDATPPVLDTTVANGPKVNGNQLVLHYTDADRLSTTGPANTAFEVRVGEAANVVTSALVDSAAKTVTLTLTNAVTAGQVVRVSYTDPSGNNDANATQDISGNDAASFTNQPVENITGGTTDTAAPVLIPSGVNGPKVNGNQLVLTYTDDNNLDSVGPVASAFAVRVGETPNVVTNAVVNPERKTVTLTLTNAVTAGQRVSVSYTDPAGDAAQAVQDATGNDAASFQSQSVENITVDTGGQGSGGQGSESQGSGAQGSGAQGSGGQGSGGSGSGTQGSETQGSGGSGSGAQGSGAQTSGTQTSSTGSDANISIRSSDDNDGVPAALEDQIPGLVRPNGAVTVAGDGNGDGTVDSQQSTVASLNGVTLVATGQNGKPSLDTNVRISALEQKAAPANLPKGLEMPVGLLDFEAEQLAMAGRTENFSLYVDPTKSINGYWVKHNSGAWVNLASEPYGGKMVTEGNRLRLDFKITDGGQFDADGNVDSSITASGAAAHLPLSITGQAADPGSLVFWF